MIANISDVNKLTKRF